MEQLLSKILEKIKKTPDIQVFRDLYYMCLECMKTDVKLATRYLVALSDECERAIATAETETYIKDIFSLHKRVLLAAAPEHFESYLLYVEWMREPEKKFYPPRRKVLKQVVDALQELEDDKLDLLAISLPPGSGKTTLAIFYLTWIAGKHADEPSLTGSHSNAFVRGVYDECLRMLSLVDLAYNSFSIESKRIEYWTGLILKADDRLKAWMKSDKERYKNLLG